MFKENKADVRNFYRYRGLGLRKGAENRAEGEAVAASLAEKGNGKFLPDGDSIFPERGSAAGLSMRGRVGNLSTLRGFRDIIRGTFF